MPPTYDFRCLNEPCQKEFDQSFSSWKSYDEKKAEIRCPACASSQVEKQISKGTSVQFKGSGFHVTDYGKRGRK